MGGTARPVSVSVLGRAVILYIGTAHVRVGSGRPARPDVQL
jgi:hypothetical protein